MNHPPLAEIKSWLTEPMEAPVKAAIERLRRAPDVHRLAIMPDVHLATDVCVGVVLATRRLLYPQAVGGDIGCGMLAVQFDAPADRLADPALAGRILSRLGKSIPTLRRSTRHALPWPDHLDLRALSHSALTSAARDLGASQLGTLGSGNHFVELQSDEAGSLWLMIHSGSRAMGQIIRDHHQAKASPAGGGLKSLDAETPEGQAYINDVEWARQYAQGNRRAMAGVVAEIMESELRIATQWETFIFTDHNHVIQETHGEVPLWIHRKGAMPAHQDMPGVLPGSMGTNSFHVEGKGNADALCSSAHGAGRLMSRESARKNVRSADVIRQMKGVWYDYRMLDPMREEAPSAYKDIRAVLRAEQDLVKVTRTLRPILNFKGR